jgi:hypothetical protein
MFGKQYSSEVWQLQHSMHQSYEDQWGYFKKREDPESAKQLLNLKMKIASG